jgi:hypothetical protein
VSGTITRTGCLIGHSWACDDEEAATIKLAKMLANAVRARSRRVFTS